MRKLFIIATSLLIIGIGLPILAANTGDGCDKRKNKDKAESTALVFEEPYQSECKKKRRAKKAKRALELEELELEKKENEKADFEGNPTFNFLYYLFYKSSINEFIKDTDYCESTGPSR